MSSNVWKLPTTELIAELRRREADELYVIELTEGPAGVRWCVWRDGATKNTPYGPTKIYTAICRSQQDADDIAKFFNNRAAERREAATK